MSKVGTAVEKIRAKVAVKASKFMPDICTVIPWTVQAQGNGHTLVEGTPVSSIPCNHEQVSGGGIQVNDNGTVAVKSHRLELPYTAETILIDRHYKIKVTARGFNPELTFEQPVVRRDAMSPFLSVFCVLSEGYRPPGVA